jgi:NADH-quinone oxidoreductase subunit H
LFINFLFIFVRANVPRYRFDQLMVLCWKIFLPITLSFTFFSAGLLISFNALKLKQLHFFFNFYESNLYIY